MKTIRLNLNEKYNHILVRTFLHNYPNYTIDFVNSKEIPRICRKIERNTLWICDRDSSLDRLHEYYKNLDRMPVIAWSHEGCQGESLMKAPWLILSPDGLTPQLTDEVICRSQGCPMTIAETSRCIIRELRHEDLPALFLLQEENKNNPAGCFFPESCAEPDVYLDNYIKYQYSFYGFGLYGIFLKPCNSFAGIAGFSLTDLTDSTAGISYSLLKACQHQGYARESVRALLTEGRKRWQLSRVIAQIHPSNTASVHLAKDLGIPVYPPICPLS